MSQKRKEKLTGKKREEERGKKWEGVLDKNIGGKMEYLVLLKLKNVKNPKDSTLNFCLKQFVLRNRDRKRIKRILDYYFLDIFSENIAKLNDLIILST